MPYIEMVDHDYVREEPGRRASARAILKKLKAYKKGPARLLEVGCAVGFLLDEAKKQGWEPYGVELSKWAVVHAREKFALDVSFGMVKKQHYPKWHFDCIVLSDTLEHLTDPKGTFIEISRILKPQGILYLNTPNFNGIRARIKGRRWPYLIALSHIYFFTFESLDKLLRTEGMRIHRRLIRPSPSPIRTFVKSALRMLNVFDELCVAATKV